MKNLFIYLYSKKYKHRKTKPRFEPARYNFERHLRAFYMLTRNSRQPTMTVALRWTVEINNNNIKVYSNLLVNQNKREIFNRFPRSFIYPVFFTYVHFILFPQFCNQIYYRCEPSTRFETNRFYFIFIPLM